MWTRGISVIVMYQEFAGKTLNDEDFYCLFMLSLLVFYGFALACLQSY